MSSLRECRVRRAADGSLVVTVGECSILPASTPGTVRLVVERSLLDARQLVPAPGPDGPPWCSLVGRTTESSPGSSRLAPGARVAAIAPACTTVVVGEERCVPLPPPLDVNTSAHWALLHVLLAVVRSTPIDLGHWLLIHGGGLTGRILAELARASGAFVVGIDPHAAESPPRAGTWARGLGEARSFLPREGADALFDLSPQGADYAALLGALRTGGRALLLRGPQSIDLDLYRDVHRRSLRVYGCDLASFPLDVSRCVRDVDFLHHLVDSGRIALPKPDVFVRATDLQSSPASVRDHALSLLVEWDVGSG